MMRGLVCVAALGCGVAAWAADGAVGPPDASWGADRLAAALQGPDAAVAVAAAAALGELRESAVAYAALSGATANRKLAPQVRGASVKALAGYGDARATMTLVGVLGDKDVGYAAASALPAFASPALTTALITTLRGDKDAAKRAAAAGVLGRVRGAGAADALAAALTDKDAGVRAAAADALGGLGDAAATEPLCAVATGDKDWRARWAAAKALGVLKDERAVTALCGRLEDKRPEVRATAAASLTAVGDVRALDPLRARYKVEKDAATKRAMGAAIEGMTKAVVEGIKP